MAPMLRRRCVCFYCGGKSSQIKTPTLRQFKCERCEAVNHLDEYGDITDPPAPSTPLPVRYGQSIQRSFSPPSTSTTDSLFCQTCLKNQHFLTESLASYLPSATPSVVEDKYEEQYQDYRRGLEERYPQVCEDCEPRVRAKIQQAGYAAKADHLRRMMDRSRSWTKTSPGWDWRYLMVRLAMLAWWASFLGQVLWNGMGSMMVKDDGLREDEGRLGITRCLSQGFWQKHILKTCSELARPLAVKAFLLGLMSIWWNPCLSTRWTRPGGKLVGLGEYYKLQGFLALVKAATLYALADDSTVQMDLASTKMAHAVTLALMLVTLPVSLMTVKIDRRAVVSFQTSNEPLIKRSPNQTHKSLPTPKRPQQPVYVEPFPINSLAPTSARPEPPRPRHPLTPPPEDEADTDGMDWTPSQPSASTFNPLQSFRPTPAPTHSSSGPSPFYGRLPLAPISPAHALLNPPNRPILRKNSAQAKQDFFNRMTNREDSPDSIATEATEVLEENLSPQKSRGIFEMSQQRFFPNLGEKLETGLESLFTGSFKIGDESGEKGADRERMGGAKSDIDSSARAAWVRTLQVISVLTACLAWRIASTSAKFRRPLRLFSLGVVAALAGRGLSTTYSSEKEFWSLSDVFIYGVELVAAVFLGNQAQGTTGPEELDVSMISGWLLGFAALQQVILSVHEWRGQLAQRQSTEARHVHGQAPGNDQAENPVPIFSTARTTSATPFFSQPQSHPHPPRSTFPSFTEATHPRTQAQPKAQPPPPPSGRKPQATKPRRSVGSAGFSGLSLGLDGADSPPPPPPMSSALVRTETPVPAATPTVSTWGGGGQQGVVRRSGRIRDQGAPWGRGTI